MSPRSRELLNAALLLTEDERIALAGELLQSVGPLEADSEWASVWRREIARRWQELETGVVQAVPWADVDRQLQQMIDASSHA